MQFPISFSPTLLTLAVAGMLFVVAPVRAGADDPFAQNACVQCHKDLAGPAGEAVHDWQQSVHHANNVGCEGCHGGNASVRSEEFPTAAAFKDASHLKRNPDFLVGYRKTAGEFVPATRGRDVSYFCGQCHADIKEKHLGSPHGALGDPTCLYCHARTDAGKFTHNIAHPTPAIIDTRGRDEGGRCSPCHQAPTMETVARVKKILIDTERGIATSGRQYAQLSKEWNYKNLELEKLGDHAKETQSRLRQIFHSFNMRDINNFAGEIQQVVDRTQATYDLIEHLRVAQHRQTIVGVSAVALLLIFAALLVYYKRSFLGHH